MKHIYILELWHQDRILRQVGAFEKEEVLEKYKLLNPIDASKYYQTTQLSIIETV